MSKIQAVIPFQNPQSKSAHHKMLLLAIIN